MQLDIFEDSRDVMLRNDVLAALERQDASAAQAAWERLLEEFPQDDLAGPLARLVDALEQAATDAPFSSHAGLRAAREALDGEVAPIARRLFGDRGAMAWLAPQWQQLARRAAPLPFDPGHEHEHAAPLWLRGGVPQAAADAIDRIPSWRRIPAPLGWRLETEYRSRGLDAAWPLLAELAWLAPARLHDLWPRLADPSLDRLRKAFDAGFEGDGSVADLAWFPAWALTSKPGLAAAIGPARRSLQTPPEQALRLMLDLLALEHQGRHHDLIERRKTLRGLQGSLYAAYMSTR